MFLPLKIFYLVMYSKFGANLFGELVSRPTITGEVHCTCDLIRFTVQCSTPFQCSHRATLRAYYSHFQVVTYQLDFSKVVLLYNIFNFVTVTLVLTSLDQSQIGSKVD
jgi:hypothetical protein